MRHKQLHAGSDLNRLDQRDHMPKPGWQGSTAPQISGLQTKRHVRAGNNGSRHKSAGGHLSQAKLQWLASYKPRRSDATGFGRDRVRPQVRKRGYIWNRRSHSARSVCTWVAMNGCTRGVNQVTTSLHPRSMAPVYVNLPTNGVRIG